MLSSVDSTKYRIEMPIVSSINLLVARCVWWGGVRGRIPGSIFGGSTGVVLHQPLNCSVFWKKAKKRQNMNGIPVSPERKTENAPTWRSPNPLFGTPFWGYFPSFFSSCLYLPHPSHIIFILNSDND